MYNRNVMPHRTRREFLASVPLALGAASLAAESAPADPDLTLHFDEPASEWSQALPIGNGRLGAMVWGNPLKEVLQLNEDTLWSGFPHDCTNPDAANHLPLVRQLVIEKHDYVGADQECKHMQGPFNESYQPVADLRLDFDYTSPVTDYSRSLDLDSAIATVQFTTGGVRITRHAIASAVDQVIAVHLEAAKPGALTFSAALTAAVPAETIAGSNTLTISGKVPAHVVPNYWASKNPVTFDDAEGKGMRFAAVVQVAAVGGKIVARDSQLHIENANECLLLISAATGYRGYDQIPDRPAARIIEDAQARISNAARKSWQQIHDAHVADHRTLFRRVGLTLGDPTPDSRPLPRRIAAVTDHADPALLALYFHFGRYLLIASSRPGTQPANLQGIWNYQVRAPWSCNWTANINVQMNYWPAETCNLSECHQPLFDLIRGVSETGARTAKVNYHLDGWVSHHNIDVWRQSAPAGTGGGSPTWANWPMSGPWLCAHLWEHYRFSGDTAFLRQAYPLMKGAAIFCLGWLIDDGHGHLTTCPSVSTENDFLTPDGKKAEVSAGCTMDMALIRELFTNCATAARQFDDSAFAAQLDTARAKLLPYRIGRYGQLQEWSEDFAESTPGQRHMSHLYGLFPGSDITPLHTPELAHAARVSLERRLANGGAYTGWSRAWAIAFWARLGDGKMAEESLTMLMKHSTGPNFFDTHPAPHGSIFQIDGNFGATAAIAEMLVQSHAGEITLLPALPDNWTAGSFRGLRLRGGAELDLAWSNSRAISGVIRGSQSARINVRAPLGQTVMGKQVAQMSVKAGKPLHLVFA